jgi:hypothetical protein
MYRSYTYAQMVARQRQRLTGEPHKILEVDHFNHELGREERVYLVAKDYCPVPIIQ